MEAGCGEHTGVGGRTMTGRGSAAIIAARAGSESCLALLLNAGADIHATDKLGNTALHGAAEKDRTVFVVASENAQL